MRFSIPLLKAFAQPYRGKGKRTGSPGHYVYTYDEPQPKHREVPKISKDYELQVDALRGIARLIKAGKLSGTPKGHLHIAHAVEKAHLAQVEQHKAELKALAPKGAKVDGRVKKIGSALQKVVRKAVKEGSASTDVHLGNLRDKPGYRDVSDMPDFTGFRIMTETQADVYKTVDAIKEKYGEDAVVSIDDKIKNPMESGYRSIHIDLKIGGLVKELQIRTKNQHRWAEWCHDIYKPQTRAQEALLNDPKVKELVNRYARTESARLQELDLGNKAGPPARLPESVMNLFGAITGEAARWKEN